MQNESADVMVELVARPIELSVWEDRLHDVDCGAQGWFAGVTRRRTELASGEVSITRTLHYEAHESMAVKQLRELAGAAAARFRLAAVVIVHRLGEVPLGQASVLVGCSSAHRKNVFDALPWIMDRLKEDVAIWKRETYDDNRSHWVHP